MYAIVRTGGNQQKVAVGDVIEIDKVATGVGETLTLPVVHGRRRRERHRRPASTRRP